MWIIDLSLKLGKNKLSLLQPYKKLNKKGVKLAIMWIYEMEK